MEEHLTREIAPAAKISGVINIPGDKAISHRLAMLGAIAEGTTIIHNFAESADCASTLECLRRLGTPIQRSSSTVKVDGRGLNGLRAPSLELDAGNSGSTVRFMSGLVAGCPFESTFVGDESLSKRPMKRVIEPLRRFGARIEARDDNYLPMRVTGAVLEAIEFTPPVASAQVKSAVLFAGLRARGTTRVHEPVPTRNHTEIALGEFGAHVRSNGTTIEVDGGHSLHGQEFLVPGDMSSAAFFIVAALTAADSRLKLSNVGLNPTRTGLIRLLKDSGGNIAVAPHSVAR